MQISSPLLHDFKLQKVEKTFPRAQTILYVAMYRLK